MRPARVTAHQESLDRRLDDLARRHAPAWRGAGDGEDHDGSDEGAGGGAPRTALGVEAPVLPVPGRHAGRREAVAVAPRAREALSAMLPARVSARWSAPLSARVRLGAAHLAVVAVVVACGLAWTCWWVVRADPRTVEAPASSVEQDLEPAPDLVRLSPVAAASDAPFPAETADAVGAATPPLGAGVASVGATAPTSAPGGSVTVDVAGRVRRPGVVVLGAGSRVVDALEAAGGARRGVGLRALNLARVLVDGEQVLVGPPPAGEPAAAAVGAVPGTSPSQTGAPDAVAPVSLNTADQVTLETLPQVGPVTAQAILAWREQHGAFTAIEELLEVDGIGDATLAQIAPHATL